MGRRTVGYLPSQKGLVETGSMKVEKFTPRLHQEGARLVQRVQSAEGIVTIQWELLGLTWYMSCLHATKVSFFSTDFFVGDDWNLTTFLEAIWGWRDEGYGPHP